MKKLRRLKTLMYKHPMWFHDWQQDKTKVLEWQKNLQINDGKRKIIANELAEIHMIADELKLTEKEALDIWSEQSTKRFTNKSIMNGSPLKEGRDNKNVHVGSGGSNRNKIRYPSKKRSIKTWKKFYKLFPWAAIEDKWDGKTSTKMK